MTYKQAQAAAFAALAVMAGSFAVWVACLLGGVPASVGTLGVALLANWAANWVVDVWSKIGTSLIYPYRHDETLVTSPALAEMLRALPPGSTVSAEFVSRDSRKRISVHWFTRGEGDELVDQLEPDFAGRQYNPYYTTVRDWLHDCRVYLEDDDPVWRPQSIQTPRHSN